MGAPATAQEDVDRRNAAFWDELCGTTMARSLGITDVSAESLRLFDEAYLGFYPYLAGYLPRPRTAGERVLEVGLGFGTVGQLLAERGFSYHGVDIAEGPVAAMQTRLARLGEEPAQARIGSALALPHPDGSFDHYVSIGCLHHTGNVPAALAEAHRVLRPGATATVMLYNARSFRQIVQLPIRRLIGRARGRLLSREDVRAAYDVDSAGAAAPHTEFFSRADARRLFARFADVQVESENADALGLPRLRLVIPRDRLLSPLGRRFGLDLYITATRKAAR